MREQVKSVYQFDGYYVECITDGTFEFYLNEYEFLGAVSSDNPKEYEQQLSEDCDMIRIGTEDGAGNTLSFKGWQKV